MSGRTVVYVLGTEGSGKSDLLRQLTCLSDGVVDTKPVSLPATTGQEIRKVRVSTSNQSTVEVELRELGGSMLPVWPSFIKSHVGRDAKLGGGVFGLMFVVDAAAPHAMTPARYGFQWLKASTEALCRDWPTVVVVQKSAAPGALTVLEVASLLEVEDAANTEVLEVDSWNGLGLGDVLDWVKQLAS